MFTVPLKNASSFTPINQTRINEALYPAWKTGFFKTLAQAYSKAPHFTAVNAMIADVLNGEGETISDLGATGLVHICQYLGIETEFVRSSSVYENNELKAQNRVIDICKKEGATIYMNAIGGMELYSKEEFKNSGIELQFIKTQNIPYKQFTCNFIPWLSIIDVLMFNAPGEVVRLLDQYEIN
jgi:hypothetical protein